MHDNGIKLDNTRNMAIPGTSQVFFHTADPQAAPWPYIVAAGGRTDVSEEDGFVSRRYHEHTFILTLSGEGIIRVGGSTFDAGPGCFAWLDTSRKYAHGADRGQRWSYVWASMSGYRLDRLHEQTGFLEQPLIKDMRHLRTCFEDIVDSLDEQPPFADAVMNARIAQILSDIFYRRHGSFADDMSDPVSKVIRQLRREIARNWDIAMMADIAGLSPSQLFRRFRDNTGTTPMSWLRLERMILARHLLTATGDTVGSIALRCGYPDPFHFSRDFKQQHGCSPRSYRAKAQL